MRGTYTRPAPPSIGPNVLSKREGVRILRLASRFGGPVSGVFVSGITKMTSVLDR